MTHHITHASMTPTHGAAKHSTITMKYSNKMQKEKERKEPHPRAAIVVTTSTWCSLDTWNAGNEESHTLHPFKERVCGSKLPCATGSLKHNCRFSNRVAEDRVDILSNLIKHLHVKYFIVTKSSFFLHLHLHLLLLRNQAAQSHLNGLLLSRITPAFPRTIPPFVNLPVPWRRGKNKPPDDQPCPR